MVCIIELSHVLMKHTKNVLKENHAETREPPPGTLIQGPTTAIHVFTF